MTFGAPGFLLLLIPLAALAARDGLRQSSAAARWPGIARLWAGRREIDLRTPAERARVRWLFWSGLALLAAALAQPRYGAAQVPAERTPREVLIALDLSRSMLARDLRPSRLDQAKLLARALLDKLAGERAGLVLFAGSAYLQLPLSEDYAAITALLPELSPAAFPKGGSDFGAMLRTGLDSFSADDGVPRTLVLLSDGEAFNDQWKPLLDDYRKRGIRILAVGLGTATGAVIPGPDDTTVKDPRTGREVITRAQPGVLQAFAAATAGRYVDGDSWINLADAVRRLDSVRDQPRGFRRDERRLTERYAWLLVPALALLWLSFCRELPVRPAQRRLAGALVAPGRPAAPAPAAAAAAVSALLFVLACQPFLRAQPAAEPEPAPSDLAEQQAEIDDPDKPTPMTRIGGMVGRRIEEMLRSGRRSSDDYAALVIDIMAFAENNLKARQRFPNSVIEDALAAAAAGEALDRAGADWARFRRDLAAMHEANNSPWQVTGPDAAGRADMETGFDPEHDMKTNGRGSGGSAPSDPAARQALDELKRKVAQNSAFGTMTDGPRPQAASYDEAPPPSPDDQVVGGRREDEIHEAEAHPELVLPLQRLALVRAEDLPAKLYQMLEGHDPNPLREGPDW